MSIGSNIKKLRIKHGLDQAQLGEIAGVTDKAVSTWENDISVPRMGAIEKMASYFGVRKSDIIEDKNTESAVIPYLGDEKINNIIKTILNSSIDKNDLNIIEAVLKKYKK